jgi:NADH dehydrogenase
MEAAVFGGTGFLGRRLVRQLVDSGWRVRVVARHPAVPEGAAPGRAVPVAADIRSRDDVAAALDGVRAAVNAVSLYVEGGGLTFRAIHVDAAEGLARQAAAADVRLIHVSGIGSDPYARSPYVAARGKGEGRVRGACPGVTVLRPSVLFGPGDAFLAALDRVTRLPVVPLFGTGATRLQPVFAADVAAAAARVLERQETAGRVFELGGGEVVTYREAVAAVMVYRGRRRPLLPVPFAVWHALAAGLSVLPSPPLTTDQLALLATDNVANPQAPGFGELGLAPAALREKLAESLDGG